MEVAWKLREGTVWKFIKIFLSSKVKCMSLKGFEKLFPILKVFIASYVFYSLEQKKEKQFLLFSDSAWGFSSGSGRRISMPYSLIKDP